MVSASRCSPMTCSRSWTRSTCPGSTSSVTLLFHALRERPAPRFPIGGGSGPDYPGGTTRGAAVDAHAALGFTLGSFDADLRVAGQEAPEFSEVRGIVMLRYVLGRR
jgi:hypothetical protein